MQQVDEDPQPLLDDRMGAASFDIDDEADATRIVLMAGIVETGRDRWSSHRNGVLSRTGM
jgi:hypothetical protein